MIREAIRPQFERLQQIMRQFCPEADERKLNALSFSVIGQCLHYRMARPIAERLIGPEAFESLDLDFLTDHITSFCLAALGCIPPLNQAGVAVAAGAVATADGGGGNLSWIAIKMLIGDKAKFLGIVMGLTFAAFLINQQGSIFCGLMLRTCGQITDITGADLWVMDPSVRYIDDVKPMLENNLNRVRGVEGVLWAVPLYKGTARAKINPDVARGNQPTVIEQVILLGP